MNDTISNLNAQRLAHLSVVFCVVNELPATQELCHSLAASVMSNIMKWYADNGCPDFNPQEEFICDEAIIVAFTRVQEIADLAAISTQTGIGMGDFEN